MTGRYAPERIANCDDVVSKPLGFVPVETRAIGNRRAKVIGRFGRPGDGSQAALAFFRVVVTDFAGALALRLRAAAIIASV